MRFRVTELTQGRKSLNRGVFLVGAAGRKTRLSPLLLRHDGMGAKDDNQPIRPCDYNKVMNQIKLEYVFMPTQTSAYLQILGFCSPSQVLIATMTIRNKTIQNERDRIGCLRIVAIAGSDKLKKGIVVILIGMDSMSTIM
jgi:hypothetical protein